MDSCACGKAAPVPSYRLVQPSFVLAKISRLLLFTRCDTNVKTGEISFNSSKIPAFLHNVTYVLVLIRGGFLAPFLFFLCRSIGTDSKALTTFLVLLLFYANLVVGFHWNCELHNHLDNLLVLLRSLHLERGAAKFLNSSASSSRGNTRTCMFPKLQQILRQIRMSKHQIQAYYYEVKADLSALAVQGFSLHDAVVLALPFAMVLAQLILFACIILNKPEILMLSSSLPSSWTELAAIRLACKVYDCWVTAFAVMSLHLGFFIGAVVQCVYHKRLQHLLQEAK